MYQLLIIVIILGALFVWWRLSNPGSDVGIGTGARGVVKGVEGTVSLAGKLIDPVGLGKALQKKVSGGTVTVARAWLLLIDFIFSYMKDDKTKVVIHHDSTVYSPTTYAQKGTVVQASIKGPAMKAACMEKQGDDITLGSFVIVCPNGFLFTLAPVMVYIERSMAAVQRLMFDLRPDVDDTGGTSSLSNVWENGHYMAQRYKHVILAWCAACPEAAPFVGHVIGSLTGKSQEAVLKVYGCPPGSPVLIMTPGNFGIGEVDAIKRAAKLVERVAKGEVEPVAGRTDVPCNFGDVVGVAEYANDIGKGHFESTAAPALIDPAVLIHELDLIEANAV